jgi:hypothetical protein
MLSGIWIANYILACKNRKKTDFNNVPLLSSYYAWFLLSLCLPIVAPNVAARSNGKIAHDGNSGIAVVPIISTVFVLCW